MRANDIQEALARYTPELHYDLFDQWPATDVRALVESPDAVLLDSRRRVIAPAAGHRLELAFLRGSR